MPHKADNPKPGFVSVQTPRNPIPMSIPNRNHRLIETPPRAGDEPSPDDLCDQRRLLAERIGRLLARHWLRARDEDNNPDRHTTPARDLGREPGP